MLRNAFETRFIVPYELMSKILSLERRRMFTLFYVSAATEKTANVYVVVKTNSDYRFFFYNTTKDELIDIVILHIRMPFFVSAWNYTIKECKTVPEVEKCLKEIFGGEKC